MHIPVLYNEIMTALMPLPGKRFLDATLGGGGHAYGLLQASTPDGRLLGTDADSAAIERCAKRLSEFGKRVVLQKCWLDEASTFARTLGFVELDGILVDLGLSSFHLDEGQRGFSFMREGPLDMRFDNTRGMSAADLVNQSDVYGLMTILREYGDVPNAKRVAEAIYETRPHTTTHHLRKAVENFAKTGRKSQINPVTLVFQALRIAVNDELNRLSRALPVLIGLLKPGGRMAIISFHSLEDGIVKRIFKQEAENIVAQTGFGLEQPSHVARVTLVNKKPIVPTNEECIANPRARSARLRIVTRI
jgi:16S rRNA (cytosine1402-N4)-methyltransferase